MEEPSIDISVEFHTSPIDSKKVASITGVDVREAGDGYSPAELRAIARILENYADHLDFQRNADTTEPLFDKNP
jgi:hypothetical protein